VISHDSTQGQIQVVEGPDQGLIGALRADGLIKAGDNTIEFKNGILTVNGSTIVAEKYKAFIKGSEMSIKISEKQTSK